MADRRTIAWDFDGTLALADRDLGDYTDPDLVQAACRPCPELVPLAQELHDAGHESLVITGRTHVLADVTRDQLAAWNLPLPVRMQPAWEGYGQMARWKALELRAAMADLYIGDHPADAAAARLAGCGFLHADTVRLMAGRWPATQLRREPRCHPNTSP